MEYLRKMKCQKCKRLFLGYQASRLCPECKRVKEFDSASMKDCKHPDCVYRDYLANGNLVFCGYILRESKSRGCDVAECDKYISAYEVNDE